MKKEWFETWFDTHYYHLLYCERDHEEAKAFIHALANEIHLPKGAKVLDLACGKGRHAVTLHELGLNVLGVDLSSQSICEAGKYAVDGLEFRVHDMRKPIENERFFAIFNLFTSFGYFDSLEENLQVLRSIHSMLEDNGYLVLDFMNSSKVLRELVRQESKEIEGISFEIERNYDDSHITKSIRFEDNGEEYFFQERVQALTSEDFFTMLETTKFNVLSTYGDHSLNDFNQELSDRFIIVAQKK